MFHITFTLLAWSAIAASAAQDIPFEENRSYLTPIEGITLQNSISTDTKINHHQDDPDEITVESQRRLSCDARCFTFHGVASGDATHDKVIIWTRLTPKFKECRRCKPRLVLSVFKMNDKDYDDYKFNEAKHSDAVESDFFNNNHRRRALYRRRTHTSKLCDFTVKLDVGPLPSHGSFKYVWKIVPRGYRGRSRRIFGFTKTFPHPNTPSASLSVRFAQVSCQYIEAGYFLAYRDIAQDPGIDFVVHTGDSIYEYGARSYGPGVTVPWAGAGIPADRISPLQSPAYSLDDYRVIHAHYKGDEHSKAAFQRKPFYMIWDDHEVVNGGYSNGSDETNETIATYPVRKQNALQAFYEWSPVRRMNRDLSEAYRSFKYGQLMDLLILEERYYAKTRPLSNFLAAVTASYKEHYFFGEQQRNWMLGKVASSTTKWQGMVSSLMVSTPHPFFLGSQYWSSAGEHLIGYFQERAVVMGALKQIGKKNIVFLVGDQHYFATRRVVDSFNYNGYSFPTPNADQILSGEVVAMEVQTTSIASPGPEDFIPPDQFAQLVGLLKLEFSYIQPEILFAVRGYLVNHVQDGKWTSTKYGYKTNQDKSEQGFIAHVECFKQGYTFLNECDCEP